MFINQDIVSIFFRFINFFTLIGLSYYLFKKHIKSDITSLITQKEADRDFLYLEQDRLEKQQLTLNALLKEEAILCEQFRAKIDLWKKAVALEDEHRTKEHHVTISKLNERIAQRTRNLQQTEIQNSIIDAITHNMHYSLETYFKNKEHATEYFNSILTFMNEKPE